MYRIAMRTPDKGTIYAGLCYGIQAWTKTEEYSKFPTMELAVIERDDRYSKGHINAGNTVWIEPVA